MYARTICYPRFVVLAVAMLLLAPWAPHANGHEIVSGDLTITHPTARPNLPNRPTAAYMVISNDGAADRLVGATSPAFGRIELHTMKMEGDVMKMEMLKAIDVPADDAAELKPGGLHLMLFDAAERFKDGSEFPMTLMFENAGAVEVNVVVDKRAGSAHGAKDGDHSGHDHGAHGAKDGDHSGHDHGAHGKDEKKKHSH